jgi:hypothetical protein
MSAVDRSRAARICPYCGRENPDQAESCFECGTVIPALPDASAPSDSNDRDGLDWLARPFRLFAIFLLITFFYFLSFGPVRRYFCRRISPGALPPSMVAGSNVVVITSVRAIGYPSWVFFLYRPAMSLSGNEIYERYLEFWDKRD